MGVLSAAIFSSAEIKPSGYRVKSTPEVSAKASRLREMASWISKVPIGGRIESTMAKIKKTSWSLFRRSLDTPTKKSSLFLPSYSQSSLLLAPYLSNLPFLEDAKPWLTLQVYI